MTRWRTIPALLAITFGYSATLLVLPGDDPRTGLVRTVVWAAAAVAVHAWWLRRGGMPPGRAWTCPRQWWAVPLGMLTGVAVAATLALPPSGQGRADLVRITVVGVIAEEAVFRGLAWEAVRAPMPGTGREPSRWPVADPRAVVVTSVLFAVAHVQYNGFRATTVLAGQLGYTVLAGLFLGWVRDRTDRLLPGALLHALGNATLKLAASVI